jgi:serine/threonine protein kinase
VDIEIGSEVDAYQIVNWLGGGGFGDVWLADDELAKRRVAIKVLKDHDPASQENLVHEMQTLGQLGHPGVVSFYHYFRLDGLLFLVMEYCAGGSLRNRLREGPIPAQTVMQWGKELAETLEVVNKKGIVHHDIKPDNLLFKADGTLKIGDFGVANRRSGTHPYVAPEMERGETDLTDARVDVYALGITLLELLCGKNPFSGLSLLEMRRAKTRHDFIPLDLERWLQEVIAKATHPTPELRFQSMGELREAIEAQHVNYVFDLKRVQAHALASQAEKQLSRRQLSAASKSIRQALFVSPDCVAAVVAAGRHGLFMNRTEEAKAHLDEALRLNPRVSIQKELGWLSLQGGHYSRAISLLTDHLQRNGNDYEAFNLLLECFYRTGRYEASLEMARMMVKAKASSNCFRNNGFICELMMGSVEEDRAREAIHDVMPFVAYNVEVRLNAHKEMGKLLLFEDYRFGLASSRPNTIKIEIGGVAREFDEPIITVGHQDENLLRLTDNFVSRRHCAVVNYANDVWIYDLGSKFGVFVDGVQVKGKTYLHGTHTVQLGDTELRLYSSQLRLV